MNTQIMTPEKHMRARGCCKVARRGGEIASRIVPGAILALLPKWSGLSCRLSDGGNRNQYFCCGGREPASVPRCLVR
jgi:hypothetical protein